MTQEEKDLLLKDLCMRLPEVESHDSPESFEYPIENHFDYHGLIPMGLANDATGLNVY